METTRANIAFFRAAPLRSTRSKRGTNLLARVSTQPLAGVFHYPRTVPAHSSAFPAQRCVTCLPHLYSQQSAVPSRTRHAAAPSRSQNRGRQSQLCWLLRSSVAHCPMRDTVRSQHRVAGAEGVRMSTITSAQCYVCTLQGSILLTRLPSSEKLSMAEAEQPWR